ncbi:MAG: hypothetical protein JRF71_13580 [Deltaproteobacteria bacterium]|nr:hypothetical protein [Deltaproteobacteria bacterium]
MKDCKCRIKFREWLTRIYESEKTGAGRVVYFSNGASEALYHWLKKKDYWEDTFFMDTVIGLYHSRQNCD